MPLSGAIAQQRNVETIANNVANANTPGFKKDQLAFKEYLADVEKNNPDVNLPTKEWKPEDFYRSYNSEDSFVKIDGTYTNHEQGQLLPTGNSFDNAINGLGFFEIQTPNGNRYTRKGNFSINKEGLLVTDQGYPVLSKKQESKDATDRTIKVNSGKLSISLDGQVFSGENKVSDLSLVEFNDIHALKKEGNSLFINPNQENIKNDNSKTSVHQGFIEQSNVNAIGEMSSLINANRNFETIQRAIKTYDSMSGKAVNEISKF